MMPTTAVFDYGRPTSMTGKQGSHYAQDICKKPDLSPKNFRDHAMHEVGFFTSIYGS